MPAPPGYENFLDDVTVPEPATLYDDYKGRTPEAIKKTMRSNLILRRPNFKKTIAEFRNQDPDITDKELLAKLYQIYIKGYYRLVKNVDDNVGRVLDYLDESGLANNTIVIYTSDQGFSLGEHGFYNKQWMYEKPLHQPLLVRFPEVIKAGQVCSSMSNHVDLAPTLLDYAGLPIPNDIQGHSLRGILEGKAEKVRDASYYHFYSHGDNNLPEMIGIRTATHKLIHYPGMKGKYQWELFDLEKDPEEMQEPLHQPGVSRHEGRTHRGPAQTHHAISKIPSMPPIWSKPSCPEINLKNPDEIPASPNTRRPLWHLRPLRSQLPAGGRSRGQPP